VTGEALESSRAFTLDEARAASTTGSRQIAKGKAIIAYAEALKTANSGDFDALQGALDQVNAANASNADPDLNEIAELIELYLAFSP
jgi:hypothetical protein